jgi:DNA-binding NarL/FixJ family response regulator
MGKIRVLLVDDNPEFLEAAIRFVATEPRIEVVGQALSGNEAVIETEKLRPDLVLMDYVMPDMNGIEATKEIKTRSCVSRIVILTMHDVQEYRSQAEAAGADGFIAKADFGRDLLPLLAKLFGGTHEPVDKMPRVLPKNEGSSIKVDPLVSDGKVGLEM